MANVRPKRTHSVMKKADLQANHEPLDDAIERYREFMERMINAQRVIRSDQERRDLAESVLLRLCASWEKFVDEHLVDCLNRDASKFGEFLGVTIPAHPNRDLCEGLLFGGGYRDFKDIGNLIGFTKKVLPETSNPFPALTTTNRKRIDEVYAIRNYLSHYSKRSRRGLMAMYTKEYGLERFREPGHFLLANKAKRLWAYFEAFEGASRDLYGFWE